MSRLEFDDINQAIAYFAKELAEQATVVSTNELNAERYKKQLGGEVTQQFFIIKKPFKVLSTLENHKYFKWWLYGEILSEMLNCNPPVMYRYKPELYSQHYDLLEDGRQQYAYSSRFTEFNEFVNVYRHLKKNPNSKRCFIPIFVPWDTFENVSDVPCLSGNTIIRSPERDISIRELANKFKKGEIFKYPVYSCNGNGIVEIQWCTSAWNSGKKRLIRIKFDNSDIIECTREHLFYVKLASRSRNYIQVRASELKHGDSIVPLNVVKGKKGFAYVKNMPRKNWSGKNVRSVARDYYEFLTGQQLTSKDIIHHKNYNCFDNSAKNLVCFSEREHNSYHKFINNPCFNYKNKSETTRKRSITLSRVAKGVPKNFDDRMRMISAFSRKELITIAQQMMRDNNKKTVNSSYWLKHKRDYAVPTGCGSRFHIDRLFGSWSTFRSIVEKNHKVASVYSASDVSVDVYDLSVENNHNVFINSGILVHNCTLGYSFLQRNGKLNMTVFYRSHDFFGGFRVYDFGLSSFVLQSLCSWLGFKPGNLGVYCNSLHFYERDRKNLEELVREVESYENSPDGLPEAGELVLDGNLSIGDFYRELRQVKVCEELAYAKSFDAAKRVKSSLACELFRDMCEAWISKNKSVV